MKDLTSGKILKCCPLAEGDHQNYQFVPDHNYLNKKTQLTCHLLFCFPLIVQ